MKKHKPKIIPFPMDRYNYFRAVLRPACEARKELMQHLQTLVEEETARHQKAWDEIIGFAGFKSQADLKLQNKTVFVDWVKCQIIVDEAKP